MQPPEKSAPYGPVAVAMSGGLDSSMSLVLLQEQGYDVIGLTMHLWREPDGGYDPADADIASAQQICQQLGVEHHVVDLRDAFYERVVCHFVSEYVAGRTPNPCVHCNRWIKFGLLLKEARALGAQTLATGHYARIVHEEGLYRLLRGRDRGKDQSYFLYTLDQETLAVVHFPLGAYHKAAIRDMARDRDLSVGERAESQDICFAQDGDYRRLIQKEQPESVRPGPIYSCAGQLLGEHRGLAHYTIGQRSGLGIAAPRPLYVVALDVERNALIVGHVEQLGHKGLIAREMNFISGHPLPQGYPVQAEIRYRARPAAACVYREATDEARVTFDEPLRDITPGQAVVFYEGDTVLGGGIIHTAMDP